MPIASLLDVWVVGSCGMARADAGGSHGMAMVDGLAMGKNTKSKWPKYKVKYKEYPT